MAASTYKHEMKTDLRIKYRKIHKIITTLGIFKL